LGIGGTHAATGGALASGGRSNNGGSIATGGSHAGGGSSVTGGNSNMSGTSTVAACPQSPPIDAAPCGSTAFTCFYDDCPNGGRTLAICSSGAWSVTIGSSCAVNCTGPGLIYPVSCTGGQVCVITGGGARMASCSQSTCGQGPVSAACAGAAGCQFSASLTSGAIFNCPSSCPAGSGGCA